jgi:hypothetical protein
MTESIFPFAMRGAFHINLDVYDQCLKADRHGVGAIEKMIGRSLLDLSWGDVRSQVVSISRAAEVRFQILYANWVLSVRSGQDTVDYYVRERLWRESWLRDWVVENPDDSFLLPKDRVEMHNESSIRGQG